MKTILFAAALAAASAAHAGTTFELKNESGGVIVLTPRPGDCTEGSKQAYATAHNARPIFGCWAIIDDRIWVKYSTGDVRVYEGENFTHKVDGVPVKSKGM